MTASPVHLVIATPAYGRMVHQEYAASLFATSSLLARQGVPARTIMAGGIPLIHMARNWLAAHFLADQAATHMLMIDADIAWRTAAPLTLLAHDLDMVCALYREKRPDRHRYLFSPMPNPQVTAGGAVEIHRAAGGFLLVKRNVFLRLIETGAAPKITDPSPWNSQILKDFMYDFFPTVYEGGSLFGEDHGFSRIWRGIGGAIHADPSIELVHYGAVPFYGDKYLAGEACGLGEQVHGEGGEDA